LAQNRIVSLLPAATEIVWALGRIDWLVGISHECDYPDVVTGLPVCTSSRLPTSRDSAAIHASLEALLSNALSVYEVDPRVLRELAPTHIITQDQCDVCAVSAADVDRALGDWFPDPPEIISLAPRTLDDILACVERVAAAIGAEAEAIRLQESARHRIEAVRQRSRAAAERPGVACIEWIEPLMASGNWVPEIVEIAGGRCLFGEHGGHSPWLEIGALVAAGPEVVVIKPCGFDLARARREAAGLIDLPGWSDLPAVRDGRVYIVDGNQYFNRPGPRIVDSAEILAEILHPEIFAFGHSGWARLDR